MEINLLEHYGSFSDKSGPNSAHLFLERHSAPCNVVEGAALLLSELGVTRAVLSAAWFPGELAKPRSAEMRSDSPYALAFSNWN